MLDDAYSNVVFLLRWLHIICGIAWIGHLYFFNFVNGPFQGVLPKELKPQVNPLLMPRALWWFRWGAMMTFVFGLALFFVKYSWGGLFYDAMGVVSARAMWIMFGMLFGTMMWFNVWFIIWPAQKKLIRWTKEGQSPPEMAALAKTSDAGLQGQYVSVGSDAFRDDRPRQLRGYRLAIVSLGCWS